MSILEVLVLSVSSSVDNLAIGLALGLSKHPLSWRLNATVSASNALGATAAAAVGGSLGGAAPQLAGLGAAGIFAYLGYGETRSWWVSTLTS